MISGMRDMSFEKLPKKAETGFKPYTVRIDTLHKIFFVKVWSKSHKKAKEERTEAILNQGGIAEASEILDIHSSEGAW